MINELCKFLRIFFSTTKTTTTTTTATNKDWRGSEKEIFDAKLLARDKNEKKVLFGQWGAIWKFEHNENYSQGTLNELLTKLLEKLLR